MIKFTLNIGTELKKALQYHQSGQLHKAEEIYKRILNNDQNHSDSLHLLGLIAHQIGKSDAAVNLINKAIQNNPKNPFYYNNLGNVFKDKGKSNEAISCYEKALAIKPAFSEAFSNMGTLFIGQGNLNETIPYYEKTLASEPDYAEAYSQLFHQLQRICDWQKLKGMECKLDDFTREALDKARKTAETPFINITRYTDLSRNFAVARSWGCNISKAMSKLNIHFSFDIRRYHKKNITIGYLSNDFRNHPMAHLMLRLFGLHNRKEFKVFCYSYGKDDESYYRTRIRQDCDNFVDLCNLNHAEAAKRIYEDQVDILVDLKGYTDSNRLEICALRPAPVQVRYLGLAGTTGADFFDYLITDRVVTPEEHAHCYSENFVYMPHSYQVNNTSQMISKQDWRKVDFGLPERGFVFCSFNEGYKIEPVMFNSWMNILMEVPDGILWLLRVNETAAKNLRREAEARGVRPERLVFAEKLLKGEHLARLRLADLALDTRIVNGAATTSDALWAGVPVITLKGDNFASLMSSSILTGIGLSELIVHSIEEYEALAVRLAHNLDELQTVRQKLTKNLLTEPLFDTPRFTKNLERAYKGMWEIFAGGEKPRQIEVAES